MLIPPSFSAGKSPIGVLLWDPSTPYIHLCVSSLSYHILCGHLGFGKNQGIYVINLVIECLFHLLNCLYVFMPIECLVVGLQMRRWKTWEDQTKTVEYQYSHGM